MKYSAPLLSFLLVVLSSCGGNTPRPSGSVHQGPPPDRAEAGAAGPKDEVAGRASLPLEPAPPESGEIKPMQVITLQPPPWNESRAETKSPKPQVKIKRLEAKKNKVTDDQEWLERNALSLPGSPTPGAPQDFAGVALSKSFQSDNLLHLFEPYGQGPSYLQVQGADGQPLLLFDFTNWRSAPDVLPGDEDFVTGGIFWAATRGDVLYVAHGHMTYAKSSKGKNAFVTALSLKDGAILWRSRPLVSNAQSFVLLDRVLVTGYGFTAEPDFLYVLDLQTGAVLAQEKLASGPTWIIRKEDEILVRSYDHDYRFQIDVK